MAIEVPFKQSADSDYSFHQYKIVIWSFFFLESSDFGTEKTRNQLHVTYYYEENAFYAGLRLMADKSVHIPIEFRVVIDFIGDEIFLLHWHLLFNINIYNKYLFCIRMSKKNNKNRRKQYVERLKEMERQKDIEHENNIKKKVNKQMAKDLMEQIDDINLEEKENQMDLDKPNAHKLKKKMRHKTKRRYN